MSALDKTGEVVATAGVAAAIMQWAPPVAALLGLIWWGMKLVIEWPKFASACRRIWFRGSNDRRQHDEAVSHDRRQSR